MDGCDGRSRICNSVEYNHIVRDLRHSAISL